MAIGSIIEGLVRHGLGEPAQRRRGRKRPLGTFLGGRHHTSRSGGSGGIASPVSGRVAAIRPARSRSPPGASIGVRRPEPSDEARTDDVDALTDADTYTLGLRAMTGAAQADGRIDDAEVENLPSRMSADEVSDADRRAVDVEEIGAAVHRPEVGSGG
jgi:hypothetical protein